MKKFFMGLLTFLLIAVAAGDLGKAPRNEVAPVRHQAEIRHELLIEALGRQAHTRR